MVQKAYTATSVGSSAVQTQGVNLSFLQFFQKTAGRIDHINNFIATFALKADFD